MSNNRDPVLPFHVNQCNQESRKIPNIPNYPKELGCCQKITIAAIALVCLIGLVVLATYLFSGIFKEDLPTTTTPETPSCPNSPKWMKDVSVGLPSLQEKIRIYSGRVTYLEMQNMCSGSNPCGGDPPPKGMLFHGTSEPLNDLEVNRVVGINMNSIFGENALPEKRLLWTGIIFRYSSNDGKWVLATAYFGRII